MYLQILVLFMCGIFVTGSNDNIGVLQFSSTEFPFNFKQVNEFLNRTSYEAISVMVFFQIVAISFIIERFSTLYFLMWLSFSFLVYNLAGPYFCLKWLLLISSLIWHCFLFLWTHPYLVACGIVFYGMYYIFLVWSNNGPELEWDIKIDLTLQKLENIENKTSAMQEDILHLSKSVELLKLLTTHSEKGEYVEDWLTDIPYPLDRKREASKKRNLAHSQLFTS